MTRWLVLCALVAGGCIEDNSVACGNGTTCPQGADCDLAHGGCVTHEQLTSCAGMPESAECLTGGACHDGVCLTIACGNGFRDPQEACDDGNNADGDMCSHDCLSNLACGNSTVDLSTGETCDDGNHIDHDGCTSTCRVETAQWLQYVAQSGAHVRAAATYDSRRDRVVLFGGTTAPNTLTAKTWEWTGTGWVERTASSTPAPRYHAAMAYDHARGRAVLFGGDGNALQSTPLADTWEWDGKSWHAVPVAGPRARFAHALVYDAARKRVVLFGGHTGEGLPFGDTWEYDGTKWTQITTTPAPPARYLMLAAYDPKRGKVVISSGLTGVSNNTYTDTWEYDGAWHDVTPSSGTKPQLSEGAMAFDPTLGKSVVFGGYNPTTGASNKTYSWDGAMWTDLGIVVAQPTARSGMSFVSAYPRPFLVGGVSAGSVYNADAYYFTGSTWATAAGPPQGSYNMVLNPLRRSHVLYGSGNTYEVTEANSALLQGGTPSIRDSPAFVADPVRGNVLMFGGAIGSAGTNETWTLTDTWTLRTPATVPMGRIGANAVFDGTRVIMFGGRATTAGAFFDETWSWDGTNWSLIPTTSAPEGRFYAAMGYDPIRKETILFGGFTYNGSYIYWNDTWAFDGTSWTERTPLVSPGGRATASLTWDAPRGHLVLSGGSGVLDAWEWTGSEWLPIDLPDIPTASPAAAAPTLDGTGIVAFDGMTRFELRWDGPSADEQCDGSDVDGDMQTACDDGDCWAICTPLCPPATSCASGGPTCGDGICSAPRETCFTCAADCQCTPVCGDFYCHSGEACPGDCPM